MKESRLIDILTKIANQEKLPKKIKFQGEIYDYLGTRIY